MNDTLGVNFSSGGVINPNPARNSSAIYNENNSMVGGGRPSVAERTRAWAEGKQKKLEALKNSTVDKDAGECTFKP
jgi:hypothetical protein